GSVQTKAPYYVCLKVLQFSGCKEFPEILRLAGPALRIHGECFRTARLRNRVEAGFDDGELCAAGHVVEPERHQCRGLRGVVDTLLDSVRMPAEGKEPLGLHRLDPYGQGELFVLAIVQLAADLSARRERCRERHSEPRVELRNVGERAPDTRTGRLE